MSSVPLSFPSPPPSTKPPHTPPNPTHLLQQCKTLTQLKQIHAAMIRSGVAFTPLPASRLVSSLSSHPSPSSLPYARLVLSQIPNPTHFTSNSLLRAYANRNLPLEALSLYIDLISESHFPDNFTFPSLFKSCRSLNLGKQIHCHAVKFGYSSDIYVQNTMMAMYSDCGSLGCARKVFDKMANRTVVSWATTIAAFVKWGDANGGLEVYREMVRENVEANEIVLVNVLTACARARDLETARGVHDYVERNGIGFNLVLWAAMLDVYCKCRCVALARKVFDEMPDRNLFCWNIMIKGYVEDGDYREALKLFREMQTTGIMGDKITMVSLVLACAHLGALDLGKWMHLYIQRENIEVDTVLATALIEMYAKCGCVETAIELFKEMPCKDVASWTALIGGLAASGHGGRALQFFDEMEKAGVRPDAVTFVGVLTACSHLGLVEKGHFYFDSMSRVYNIEPTTEHYGWIVDLLGRSGHVEKAEEFIKKMPMALDYFVLCNLLSACRVRKNLEAAERIARRILELDSKNGATFVMLSNLYASLDNLDESKRMQEIMREKNIKKPAGCSMIEVKGEVHEFVDGDSSDKRMVSISVMIEDMVSRLNAEGYDSKKSKASFNMDEEEEDGLHCCSEIVAIAFGLMNTSLGMAIRVKKNLRVHGDCHDAIKKIAEIYGREIVIRDRFRIHRFRYGACSCKDFW